MFIHFEFLRTNNERIELMVSTPKEAVSLMGFLDNNSEVKAWKCLSHAPQDFGCAFAESGAWKKIRTESYLQSDFER